MKKVWDGEELERQLELEEEMVGLQLGLVEEMCQEEEMEDWEVGSATIPYQTVLQMEQVLVEM